MFPRKTQSPDLGLEPEEGTPLLHKGDVPRTETPLPITQIVILLLLSLSDPITSLSIRPYINQLVSELPVVGGDEIKVGYYAGIIVSLYFVAQAITVLQWSRLSDKVGRKPVLLCGLLGSIVSGILFGLSRSFWALALSRCLHGILSGNIGVMKSMMVELTDESNLARGSSLISLSWAAGVTIGPFIGGVLSRPQDRWPNTFSHHFWGEYPYFLPCLAIAACSLLSFSLAAIFLKETVTSDPVTKPDTESNSDLPQVGEEILDGPVKDAKKLLPLRALLTRPVVVSVVNYSIIGLLDAMASALIPLAWSTSIELGGLSMSPASIGLLIAGYGLINGIFQFVAFPHIVRRFGPRRVFIASILCFSPVCIMIPFENLASRHSGNGLNTAAGLLIFLQLLAMPLSNLGFGAIFMYISSAAPNKRSLGATNGLAQTMISIQRAIGPTAAASLFAFSLEKNILGGNFVYIVMFAIVLIGLRIAMLLPKDRWEHDRQ